MKLTYAEYKAISEALVDNIDLCDIIGMQKLGLDFNNDIPDFFHVRFFYYHEENEELDEEELEERFLREIAEEIIIKEGEDEKYVDYDENAGDYRPYTPAFWNMFMQKSPLFCALGFTVDQVKEKLGIKKIIFFDIDKSNGIGGRTFLDRYAAWIEDESVRKNQ